MEQLIQFAENSDMDSTSIEKEIDSLLKWYLHTKTKPSQRSHNTPLQGEWSFVAYRATDNALLQSERDIVDSLLTLSVQK